jgi:hypothetical protein
MLLSGIYIIRSGERDRASEPINLQSGGCAGDELEMDTRARYFTVRIIPYRERGLSSDTARTRRACNPQLPPGTEARGPRHGKRSVEKKIRPEPRVCGSGEREKESQRNPG